MKIYYRVDPKPHASISENLLRKQSCNLLYTISGKNYPKAPDRLAVLLLLFQTYPAFFLLLQAMMYLYVMALQSPLVNSSPSLSRFIHDPVCDLWKRHGLKIYSRYQKHHLSDVPW